MGEEYEQFYRTWCYSGQSVSGADGWKIRAKSDGLALQEAEGMADLANYWSPTVSNPTRPAGRRLALFRGVGTGSVLVHGVLRPGLVGGRAGVSFEHAVVGLPRDLDALEAIKFWGSTAWCLDDGDFGSKLGKFVWNGDAYGPEFGGSHGNGENGQLGDADGAVALGFLGQSDVIPWASYVLRACLASASGVVEKFYLAGRDDTVAKLLFVAFYCLPERLRREATFSTHENPKSTKGVRVVGVTTFEGEESDFASYSYGGKYCALNTFTESRSENLVASSFAESAVQWILCGQYGLLSEVRRGFDALDPADNPTVGDLDLLAACLPAVGDGAVEPDMLVKLCGSVSIGRARIRDREGLAVLIRQARQSDELRDGVASQFGAWVPRHGEASREFPAGLAQVAFRGLCDGRSFEDVAWLADFARRVSGDLEIKFWEELLVLCRGWVARGPSAEGPLPEVSTRLSLLGIWHQWHRLPEERAGDAFADVVGSWLQVPPQDLGVVLNSGLKEELKREAVSFWAASPSAEACRGVIELARGDGRFRAQVVGQLAGLLKERRDALTRFPSTLAAVALGVLRGGGGFEDVAKLGSFAGEAGAELERIFWVELLVACRGTMKQGSGGQPLLPALGARLSLLDVWARLGREKERNGLSALAEFWLSVAPGELARVLGSTLPAGLKGDAVRLCLVGSAALDAQTCESVFGLICKDAELTKIVFLGMPTWQAHGTGAISRVSANCLSMLLSASVERMRLVDMLGDSLVNTVGWWSARAPKGVVPALMQALLCFGQYVRSPGSFSQTSQFATELLQPEIWTRERDSREEAVNGALDGVLSRGDLNDFERALGWFGERRWASSGSELVRLANKRVEAKSVRCRDGALEGVLSVLDRVLREWEEARQGRQATARSDDFSPRGMEGRAIGAMGRIAMRYLPGSSLLKSASGHQIIEVLDAECQVLEPIQRGWVQKLHSLLEVLNAPEFRSEDIETLAKSYVALNKDGDAEMRGVVNARLLELVSKKPKALSLALVAFVNNVYAKDENLFLRGFMPGLVEELIRLEQKSESGAVAEVFISFCLEGCFLEQGGNFADRRSFEMSEWLGRFKRGLTTKSIARVNRIAQGWDSETRDRWYRESGYRPSWISRWRADARERREERKVLRRQPNKGAHAGRGWRRLMVFSGLVMAVLAGALGAVIYFALHKGISLYQQVRDLLGH